MGHDEADSRGDLVMKSAEGFDFGSDKARLARELNVQIRAIGGSLTEATDESEALTFFCECGCMAEVRRSIRDYDAVGALIEGHSRPAAS